MKRYVIVPMASLDPAENLLRRAACTAASLNASLEVVAEPIDARITFPSLSTVTFTVTLPSSFELYDGLGVDVTVRPATEAITLPVPPTLPKGFPLVPSPF